MKVFFQGDIVIVIVIVIVIFIVIIIIIIVHQVELCDLGSLPSVRLFAAKMLETEAKVSIIPVLIIMIIPCD